MNSLSLKKKLAIGFGTLLLILSAMAIAVRCAGKIRARARIHAAVRLANQPAFTG